MKNLLAIDDFSAKFCKMLQFASLIDFCFVFKPSKTFTSCSLAPVYLKNISSISPL